MRYKQKILRACWESWLSLFRSRAFHISFLLCASIVDVRAVVATAAAYCSHEGKATSIIFKSWSH